MRQRPCHPALRALLLVGLIGGTSARAAWQPPPVETPEAGRREAALALLRFEQELVRWEHARGNAARPGVERHADRTLRTFVEDLDRIEGHLGVGDPLGVKTDGLRRLLKFFDERGRADAGFGATETPYGRIGRALPVEPGRACGRGPILGLGTWSWAVDTPPGVEGVVWFRLESGTAGRLHTGGSRVDTTIEVFASCADAPLRVSDDEIGLQSSLLVESTTERDLYVRVGGLASAPGSAVVLTVEGGGTGSLAGTVTESGSGTPVVGTRIELRTSTGSFVGSQNTAADGSYAFNGLADGSYLVRTENSSDHVDEVWDDHPCDPSCPNNAGDPIAIAGGPVTADFELALGGRITGRVLEVGGGIVTSGSVRLTDEQGSSFDSDSLSGDGRFEFPGLPAGVYFLYTSVFSLRDEVWDDIPCEPSCQPTNGTPIQVELGGHVGDLVFELDRFGGMAGTLSDNVTGASIPFGSVYVFDATGGFVDVEGADASGRWEVGGLTSGTYFAATNFSSTYRNEVFDDIPCQPTCQPTTGNGITVQLTQTTEDIDFALDRLGGITGNILDEATLLPVQAVRVELWNDAGNVVSLDSSTALGHYEFSSLQPDTYFVVTNEDGAYIDELFDGIPCPTGPPLGCAPDVEGTPLTVGLGSVVGPVDLALSQGGSVSGTLRDGATHQPIVNAPISLWRQSGAQHAFSSTGSGGSYFLQGIPGGTYFVTTNTNSHVDEAWEDIPCEPGCDPTAATPIEIQPGVETTGIDFDLTLLGGIAGVVVDDAGQPLSGVQLHAWASFGAVVGAAVTREDGFYQVDLGSGVFRLSTANSLGLPDELWDNVPCPDGPAIEGLCEPTMGDPITVIGSQPVLTGFDIVLGSSLFADGFESGDASAWSLVVP